MRLKKTVKKLEKFVGFKCTVKQANRIKRNANLYTEGNVSEWVLYAALRFEPKKEDLDI